MYNYNYPPNFYFDGNNLRNYQNNNYHNDNLFNPYEGLIRGNLFKNIYDPYKNQKPYTIKPMNNQAKMLTDIDSLDFAIIDLNLYLDIYPDDKYAIDLFNKYRNEQNELLHTYQNEYGPILLNSDALNNIPWMWDNKPWPWEN